MKYTVFELIAGKFVWYVHDEDGNEVDSWSRTQYVENDTLKGGDAFKTEDEARKHVTSKYPDAQDVHTFK